MSLFKRVRFAGPFSVAAEPVMQFSHYDLPRGSFAFGGNHGSVR